MFALFVETIYGRQFLRVAPDTAKLVTGMVDEISRDSPDVDVCDVFGVFNDERDELLESLFVEAYERKINSQEGDTV